MAELNLEAEQLKEMAPETLEEIERKRMVLEQRFLLLVAPVREKRQELEARNRLLQLFRDLEDEQLWIAEKRALCMLDDLEPTGTTPERDRERERSSISDVSSERSHAPRRLQLIEIQLMLKKHRVGFLLLSI